MRRSAASSTWRSRRRQAPCTVRSAEEYPFETGLAIVKAFSDAWNGCPEELCDEQTDEFGVDD